MKTIVKKEFNRVLNVEVTKVFIEVNGELEFFGEAHETDKVIALVAEAEKFVRNNR